MHAGPSNPVLTNAAARRDDDSSDNESLLARPGLAVAPGPALNNQTIDGQGRGAEPGHKIDEDIMESVEPGQVDVDGQFGDGEELFGIDSISDWHYIATKSKDKPAAMLADGSNNGMLYDIELEIIWVKDQEQTWEPEAELQMTAGEAVWGFWESLDQIEWGYARNRALGREDNDMYVPLRVTNHRRRARTANRTGRTWYRGRRPGRRGRASRRVASPQLEYEVEWVGYRERTWERARGLDRELLDKYWAGNSNALEDEPEWVSG